MYCPSTFYNHRPVLSFFQIQLMSTSSYNVEGSSPDRTRDTCVQAFVHREGCIVEFGPQGGLRLQGRSRSLLEPDFRVAGLGRGGRWTYPMIVGL